MLRPWISGARGKQALTVIVNGDEKDIAAGSAITDLIGKLDLKPERVAVELNHKILKRSEWASTVLAEGDKLEIVHFVGGGSL